MALVIRSHRAHFQADRSRLKQLLQLFHIRPEIRSETRCDGRIQRSEFRAPAGTEFPHGLEPARQRVEPLMTQHPMPEDTRAYGELQVPGRAQVRGDTPVTQRRAADIDRRNLHESADLIQVVLGIRNEILIYERQYVFLAELVRPRSYKLCVGAVGKNPGVAARLAVLGCDLLETDRSQQSERPPVAVMGI